jgi:predicted enzyme related to lactoylglutathione lyase
VSTILHMVIRAFDVKAAAAFYQAVRNITSIFNLKDETLVVVSNYQFSNIVGFWLCTARWA